MSPDLRTALRDLAPEPPAGLGSPETARRRARQIRRRRYAAVASAATLAVVAAFGVTIGGPARDGGDFAGSRQTGAFPNWPRRGDVTDPAVTGDAVRAWFTHLKGRDPMGEKPDVLYGGGGARPVFVLHGDTHRGGERLAVVTRDATGAWDVVLDTPAPLRDAVVTVHLEPPRAAQHPAASVCRPAAASHASRLLVLGPPETRSARWRQNRVVPPHCADRTGSDTPWTDVPLTEGAGLVAAPVTPYGGTEVEVVLPDRVVTGAPTAPGQDDGSYGGLVITETWSPVMDGWPYRTDRTRAELLSERMADAVPGSGECRRIAAFSLSDSTPVAACAATDGDGYDVVMWAEGADRVVREYRGRTKMLSDVAMLVDGHTARWLVVVGPAALDGVAVVDGDVLVPVRTTLGVGWVEAGEAGPGARVTTNGYGPGGGFAIWDRTGDEVRW